MKNIILLCCLITAMYCAATNVVRMANSDCCSPNDCGNDMVSKEMERRRGANRLTARMYAAAAANKSGKPVRIAIMKQGSLPAPENLQYPYAFTNDVAYACLAAGSIVQIVGVTSNSIEVADHAISLSSVPKADGYRLCEIIVQKANEATTPLDCKRLAVDALEKYATRVSGAEALAKHIRMEQVGLPRNVAVNPISNEVEVSREERIKAAFLFASAPRYCGTETAGAYQRAVDLCGGDSRLISRIAKEIAVDHTNRVPWAISVLINHGSSEDVPFLLSYTNDLDFAAQAVSAVILIDGITSNAVELANDIMYRNLKQQHDRYDICSALAYAAKRDEVSVADKQLSISSLKRYSRTIPATALWADKFLLSLDPDYETSDDRKALLREVAERRVNDYQVDYATNALKRIDAKVTADAAKESR